MENKVSINLNIFLADYDPMTGLLNIISEMVADDRVPAEYRFKMLKVLAPFTAQPKQVKTPEQPQ